MATLSALILLTSIVGVFGFPGGPPTAQCLQMMPTGHGPTKSVGPPPYNISTTALSYTVGMVGSTFNVSIDAADGTIFKGFFIQARRSEPGSDMNVAIGTFSDIPSGTQTLACNSIQNSAWGHSNNLNKTSVTATWNAPMQAEGDVMFRATIVSGVPDRTYYYVGVMSQSIDGPPRSTDGPTERPMTIPSGGTAVKSSALLAIAVSVGAYLATAF